QLLTHWLPEREPEEGVRHEVQRQLDLAAAIGCRAAEPHLSLAVPPGATETAAAILRRAGVDPRGSWALIHPGATAASRRYAPQGFAEVAAGLVRDAGLQVVVAGGAGEADLVEQVRAQAGVPVVPLAGVLSFAELAALIALAPVLICNNSGP